jgi:hypothetical protein
VRVALASCCLLCSESSARTWTASLHCPCLRLGR